MTPPSGEPMAFPPAEWDGLLAQFAPCSDLPSHARPWAVVVFVAAEGGLLLADIEGRGWSVPSGRLVPGESVLEAAAREVREETGAELLGARIIGLYTLRSPAGSELLVPAVAGRAGRIGPIPKGSESRGVRAVPAGEIPRLYYRWDPLLEAVFAYAWRCLAGASGSP